MENGWNQLKISFNRDLESRILKTIQDLESERTLRLSIQTELKDTLNMKENIENELHKSSQQLFEVNPFHNTIFEVFPSYSNTIIVLST